MLGMLCLAVVDGRAQDAGFQFGFSSWDGYGWTGSYWSEGFTGSPIGGGTASIITTQPGNQTVALGQSANFLDGTLGAAYQWQVSTNGGVTWGNLSDNTTIAGSATNTLTVSNTTEAMNQEQFQVLVTQGSSSQVSTAATLTVVDTLPNIESPPSRMVSLSGNYTTFTVVADSPLPLTYQWLKDGSPIDGATETTLTLTGARAAHAGNYSVTVTNAIGSVTSAVITLALPSINYAPPSQTQIAGNTTMFTVIAYSVVQPSYQWFKDGQAIPGATSAQLTLTNVQMSDAGNYSVTVTNSAGSVTTVPCMLTVLSTSSVPPVSTVPSAPTELTAPNIITQPTAATIKRGNAVTFTVAAGSTVPMTYQWERNGAKLRNGGGISGVLTRKLSLSRVTMANAGNYQVVVSNSAGNVTSAAAALRVK